MVKVKRTDFLATKTWLHILHSQHPCFKHNVTCCQWLFSLLPRSCSLSSFSWSHSFIRPWACSTFPWIPICSASSTKLFIFSVKNLICSSFLWVWAGERDICNNTILVKEKNQNFQQNEGHSIGHYFIWQLSAVTFNWLLNVMN